MIHFKQNVIHHVHQKLSHNIKLLEKKKDLINLYIYQELPQKKKYIKYKIYKPLFLIIY